MSSAGAGKPRPPTESYLLHLERSCHDVINGLHVHELQKKFLRDRWLRELLWYERKAKYHQKRHYALRLVTIVGGVIVPSLVSLDVRKTSVAEMIAWSTFAVSLVVAIAAALESFFGYGERWRRFERTAEALKAHGWQFFQLVGHYAGAGDHPAAFPRFVTQVEALFQQDIETFITHTGQHQPTPNPNPVSDLEPEPAIMPAGVPTAPAPS
jgi:hypothetical protein